MKTRIIYKSVTGRKVWKKLVAGVMCLLFFNDLAVAGMRTATLSPELAFQNPQESAELRAAMICKLIEQRAHEWKNKSIEDIYLDDMLLWQRSTEPLFDNIEPKLSADKKAITIDMPGSDVRIRYYDRNDKGVPVNASHTDLAKTTIDMVPGTSIVRQILRSVKALPAPEEKSPVRIEHLTKEFAIRNAVRLTELQNKIEGTHWAPEQMIRDFWRSGTFGQKTDRVFYSKWEHSFAALDRTGKPVGLLIAYERPGGEMDGIDGTSLYIHGMAVDEGYRQRGIASELMKETAWDLLKKGFRTVRSDRTPPIMSLQTGTENKIAQRFYEQLGYERVGTKHYERHDDYVYKARASVVVERSSEQIKTGGVENIKIEREAPAAGFATLMRDTERLADVDAIINDFDGVDRKHEETVVSEKVIEKKRRLSSFGVINAILTGLPMNMFFERYGGQERMRSPEAGMPFYVLNEAGAVGHKFDSEARRTAIDGYNSVLFKDLKTAETIKDILIANVHKMANNVGVDTGLLKDANVLDSREGVSFHLADKKFEVLRQRRFEILSNVRDEVLKLKKNGEIDIPDTTEFTCSYGGIDIKPVSKGASVIQLIKLKRLRKVVIMADSIGTKKNPGNDRSMLALTREDLKKAGIDWNVDLIKIYVGNERETDIPADVIRAPNPGNNDAPSLRVYNSVIDAKIKWKKELEPYESEVRRLRGLVREMHAGYFSNADEAVSIAEKLPKRFDDILMKEPVWLMLEEMKKIVRARGQADLLLKIDRIVNLCSNNFAEKNVSSNVLISAYLKRHNLPMHAERLPIGPILGRTLTHKGPYRIKREIVAPLLEVLRSGETTGSEADKYYDLFAEMAEQLPSGFNDIIFPEVVDFLLGRLGKADHKVLNVLNSILDNSDIYENEKEEIYNGKFDPANKLHRELVYVLSSNVVYRGRYSYFPRYNEFLESLKGRMDSPDMESEGETVKELKAVVYEAYLTLQEILSIKKRANELGRKVVVVENLSYGAVALAPIKERRGKDNYIRGTDIRVISTKIASKGEDEILASLFSYKDLKYFAEEQPIVIVVDGTPNVSVKEGQKARMPAALIGGYCTFFSALNYKILREFAGRMDPKDAYAVNYKLRTIADNKEFQRLWTYFSYFRSKEPASIYDMYFWYPGKFPLDLRDRQTEKELKNVSEIDGPSVIMIQTVSDTLSLREDAVKFIGKGHIPGYFDDTGYFKHLYFKYDGKGPPELVNYYADEAKKMFKGLEDKEEGNVHHKYGELTEKISDLVKTLLCQSNEDVLFRVPVEILDNMSPEDIRDFFAVFRDKNNSRGYIEFFRSKGESSEVGDDVYLKYGLRRKPSYFKRKKRNTVTLLSVSRDEISPDEKQAKKDLDRIIEERTGGVPDSRTQIVPVGRRNDAAGLLRGTAFGFILMHLAREKSGAGLSDAALTQDTFAQAMMKFYDEKDIERVGLKIQDLIDMATGNINMLLPVLRKLVELLPIEPVDARKIYENTRKVWIAA